MDAFPSLPSSGKKEVRNKSAPSPGRDEDSADVDSALAAAAATAESAVAGLDMMDLNDSVYEPSKDQKSQGSGTRHNNHNKHNPPPAKLNKPMLTKTKASGIS